MCRFGMDSHVREKDGERRLVKKPTGFMTSARCLASQLDVRCDGGHEHVHLVGGRASAAQVYPPELCKAILRGIVRQKAVEAKDRVSTRLMNPKQLRSFVSSLSCGSAPLRSLVNSISKGSKRTVIEAAGKTNPVGDWPVNWVDTVHEPDGGSDQFGSRPQNGIEILRGELDAIIFRDGISVATDDVSGAELVPSFSLKRAPRKSSTLRNLECMI